MSSSWAYFNSFVFSALLLFCFNCDLAESNDLSYYDMLELCDGNYISAIAYPGDDEKYIVCTYNNPIVGSCSIPSQTVKCFNEEKQDCSGICSQSNVNSVTTYCQTNDIDMMTLIPATDCEHFYICMDDSDAIYGTCPDGLQFSIKDSKCVPIVNANCPLASNVCASRAEGYKFSADSCYQYYECHDQKDQLMSCEYGSFYNNKTDSCVTDDNRECLKSSQRKPVCTASDNGRHYSHVQCNKYYVCVNSIPYEAQCPTNYYFNAQTSNCEYGNCN